jgi:hypothetical protein
VRYYLDTEFNGFGGELMSLALVPESPERSSFYVVVPWSRPLDPWVLKHVVPFLNEAPVSRDVAATRLGDYLRGDHAAVIVADWPTDFEHLLGLLITGPGQMVRVPDFGMEFRRLDGFNTASTSRAPHNALADAEALRDYCEGKATP